MESVGDRILMSATVLPARERMEGREVGVEREIRRKVRRWRGC
jgi:hypothetical protein